MRKRYISGRMGMRLLLIMVRVGVVLALEAGWLFSGVLAGSSAQSGGTNHLYLPLVSKVLIQTGPAIFTSSYYMKTVDGNVAYQLGCALGLRDGQLEGYQDNLVVLDYGRPVYQSINGQMAYGTRLFIYTAEKVNMNQIAASAERFGEGYYVCTDKDTGSHLKIGVGTSNYEYYETDGQLCSGCSLTYEHGQAFGRMVNDVNTWLVTQGYSSQVSAAGASDIELTWNTFERTRNWLDGYDSVNQYELYNYGALEGCPFLSHPTWNCAWPKDEVWYAIWGSGPVSPVPEIYLIDGINAEQWYLMSVYSYTAHGQAIQFPGLMTQSQSCESAAVCNSPLDGWTQLQTLVNSDARTAYPIRWVTDIRYP